MKAQEFPDLEKLFYPKTIAVIGASTDPEKIGGRPLSRSIKHGTKAKIYAVNPRAANGNILGFPCYSSVGEIPDDIDLAIIALPAKLVINGVKESVAKKIPFGIIFASGFGELGEEGKAYEKEVVKTANEGGMRLIGPNCQGVINLQETMVASFTPALAIDKFTPGHIGFVSQSGAFGGSVFNFVQQRRIGLSQWVSIGNQCDLDIWDCFNYMIDDKNTLVLSGYLEGIKDGRKMMAVADKALKAKKPIILLRGGISERGAKAVLSHTGSIVGSSAVASSVFKQKGIIEVDGVEELFDIAILFAEIKKHARDGIGILTTSGAAGVLLTDRFERYGLNLAPLSDSTRMKLTSVLPDFGSVANPVDLTAQMINQPKIFTNSLDIFLEDETIGFVIIMYTMVVEELADICARKLVEAVPKSDKPVVICWMATTLADNEINIVRQANIPVFETPYRCARAVNAIIKYNQFVGQIETKKEKQKKEKPLRDLSGKAKRLTLKQFGEKLKEGRTVLTEFEALGVLKENGFSVPRGGLANNEKEALTIAKKIGYPVVVKVNSPDILHKSDAGGIRLGIHSDRELKEAYKLVLNNSRRYDSRAEIKGAAVMEMLTEEGVECIIGTHFDADFGWTLMFGLGGIFVEIIKDVSVRVVPLSRSDAESMITEVKGYQLLKGARGQKEKDIKGLTDFMLKTSQFLENYGDRVKEFEINPLIILPKGKGVFIADCLMALK